jgi:hypothetical protein
VGEEIILDSIQRRQESGADEAAEREEEVRGVDRCVEVLEVAGGGGFGSEGAEREVDR